MIDVPWFVLVIMLLGDVVATLVVVTLVVIAREDRAGRVKNQRAAYLAWCLANGWCPEHDRPDDDGHTLITPNAAPYLAPCPGSTTRRYVPPRPWRLPTI